MRRTRSGKRIELTARDIAIFKLLRQYRYLRSTYIRAFVGGASATRFKERLGDLFHEGYLDRPAQQWEYANAKNRPAVYQIGTGALRALQAAGEASEDARAFLRGGTHRQFLHSLMICEVLASMELATRATPGLRFIAWPEILARAPDATRASEAPFRLPLPSGGYLVPDGVFGIEYRSSGASSYRFFALEADRGTMPVARSREGQTSYLGKLTSYREIVSRRVHKSHLAISTFLVLTLTTSDARLSELIRRLEGERDIATFLFKSVSTDALRNPTPELLGDPWERAGLPPLVVID